MKFINLFAGALVATTAVTAANVLLASNAYGCDGPGCNDPGSVNQVNGWTQQGKGCQAKNNIKYFKLRKNSNKSIYAVRINENAGNGDRWTGDGKNMTLAEANEKMNIKCNICGGVASCPDGY